VFGFKIVAVLLILIGMLFPMPVFAIDLEEGSQDNKFMHHYRLSKQTRTPHSEFVEYVQTVNQHRGNKIAFIGDSVVTGVSSQADETIPVFMEAKLQENGLPIQIYNFGLPGGRFLDHLFMMRYVHQYTGIKDYVMNISYPFFSEEIQKSPSIYYPMFGDFISREELKRREIGEFKHNDEQNEESNPVESSNSQNSWEQNKYRVWNDTYWDKERLAHYEKVYNVNDFEKDQRSLQPFIEILKYAKMNDINIVFVVSPINTKLLSLSDKFDKEMFEKNNKYITDLVSSYDFHVYSYQQLIPNEYFNDSIHLLGPANKMIGEKLAKDWLRNDSKGYYSVEVAGLLDYNIKGISTN
jgi:hypothetical protein